MTRLPPIATTLLLSVAVAAISLTLSSDAQARESRVASYPMEKAWPSAVRFLRIDLGYTIVERDPQAGYVIFDVKHKDKKLRGSLELVRTKDYAERDSVKMILEIKERPDYEEAWVLEKMIERMREDLGQPVDKEKEPPTEDKPPEDGEKREDSADPKPREDKK